MPSTTTITSTDLTTFAALARIRSSEVNNNFAVFRGHLLPVDPTTSAATHQAYDLGSTDHKWRNVYAQTFVGDVTGNLTGNVTGNYFFAVTTCSATYSCTSSDVVVLCDASTAAFTVNLPTAVGVKGLQRIFKKTDTSVNAITIDGSGTETIDGTLTAAISVQYEVLRIVSDGANWQVIG